MELTKGAHDSLSDLLTALPPDKTTDNDDDEDTTPLYLSKHPCTDTLDTDHNTTPTNKLLKMNDKATDINQVAVPQQTVASGEAAVCAVEALNDVLNAVTGGKDASDEKFAWTYAKVPMPQVDTTHDVNKQPSSSPKKTETPNNPQSSSRAAEDASKDTPSPENEEEEQSLNPQQKQQGDDTNTPTNTPTTTTTDTPTDTPMLTAALNQATTTFDKVAEATGLKSLPETAAAKLSDATEAATATAGTTKRFMLEKLNQIAASARSHAASLKTSSEQSAANLKEKAKEKVAQAASAAVETTRQAGASAVITAEQSLEYSRTKASELATTTNLAVKSGAANVVGAVGDKLQSAGQGLKSTAVAVEQSGGGKHQGGGTEQPPSPQQEQQPQQEQPQEQPKRVRG